MIITIVSLILFILGLICVIISRVRPKFFIKICDKVYDKSYIRVDNIVEGTGYLSIIVCSIVLFICILLITTSHACTDLKIEDANITYETLLAKIESVDSNYEDIAKNNVLSEVEVFNKNVLSEKYWTNNQFTNWFHNKEYVDSLKYIDINSLK